MVQPEKMFRVGACSASVFNNQVTVGGENRVVTVVKLQRAYKAPDGQYRYVNSFKVDQLPQAILALTKAYEHLVLTSSGSDSPGEG